MRLITVTPAGRRRYLEVLASYLLRNRHVIDEHHWWANTRNPDDLAYLHRLLDQYPDFFRLVAKPIDATAPLGDQIWSYMSDCAEPNTVYLRLDDDICYIADDAIPQILEYRLANPDPFLVLGTIVNNSICSHSFQAAGRVPESWGHVSQECLDPVGWESGRFARRLHHRFLRDVRLGLENRWKGIDIPFDGIRRFSVNAICWRGEDMQQVEERYRRGMDEEVLLTAVLPRRFERPNAICPNALFGHFAFYTQRKELEMLAPEVLDQYRRIAFFGASGADARPDFGNRIRLSLTRGLGRAQWTAREAIHGAKRLLKSFRGSRNAQQSVGEASPQEQNRDDEPAPHSGDAA